ncbi:MAG: PAS domain S-box protein, partial [Ramlibacter sp.]
MTVAGGLAFLVFGTVLAVIFGRRITAPIAVLAAQADSMASGNLVAQGPALRITELQTVQRALADASRAARERAVERERLAAEQSASAERARSEAEMRRVAAFNAGIMNNLAEGLYTLDERGLVTFMNPAAEELFGWSFAELRGKHMHDITHHHDAEGRHLPAGQCPVLRILGTGQRLVNQKDLFIRKDGTFFPVEYSMSPMRDAAGKITGAVVAFSDISERKRFEMALRTTTQRLDSALGNSPLAVIEWTTEEFRIRRWSGEATRVFGWT